MITRCPLIARTSVTGFLLLLTALISPLFAAPLEEWQWSNPVPQGNSLYTVCHGNGQWIAVGEFGTILTSADATNWTRAESGTTETLLGCTYGDGQFVVVGKFGTILTSSDARSWSYHFAATFYDLNSVTFGNGQYVAVGLQGTILTSADGIDWTQRATGPINLYSVAYGSGTFLAVGGDVILTSTNGTAWFRRALPVPSTLNVVKHSDGKFVAIAIAGYDGNDYLNVVLVSQNGTDWSATSFPAPLPLRSIAFGADIWTAVASWADSGSYGGYEAGGMVFTSTDLVQWTTAASNAVPLMGVEYEDGRFVAVSYHGSIVLSSTGVEWQSPSPGLSGVPYGLSDLQYLNGNFVGLASDRVSFSSNGLAWTPPHVIATNVPYGKQLVSIAYGKGIYVAGGQSRRMWTSVNGLTWSQVAPELDLGNTDADVNQVIFANDMFMAVPGYRDNVMFSTNGVNWWVKNVRTNLYYFRSTAIAYGGGTCVVLGESSIAASSDLTNWAHISHQEPIYLKRVTFGSGRFVAVGYSGIYSSSDGTNWFGRSSAEFGHLTDVAFGEGYFVAVGSDPELPVAPQRKFWVSTNGVDWSARPLSTRRGFTRIAYGGGIFVASGNRSAILRCLVPPAQAAVAVSLVQGGRAIVVKGIAGRSYQIECVNEFSSSATWIPLGTVPTTDGVGMFTDTSSAQSQRFYRAVLVP